jgi:hypothetical protein
VRRLAIVTALVGVSCIVAPPASAAAPRTCADRVLVDWYDNGRIDRSYPLRCYEDAVAGLPPDLRDYTDAAEVITRALQRAARQAPASARAAAVEPASSSRAHAVALVGGSVAIAAAGLGYVAWRRRSS